MSKLSLLDLGFFIAETEASPKHVAGLLIFKRPPKSTPAFAKNLFKEYLAASDVKPPFNRVINFSMSALPHWVVADHIDMRQHVFFHTLPKDGNDRRPRTESARGCPRTRQRAEAEQRTRTQGRQRSW